MKKSPKTEKNLSRRSFLRGGFFRRREAAPEPAPVQLRTASAPPWAAPEAPSERETDPENPFANPPEIPGVLLMPEHPESTGSLDALPAPTPSWRPVSRPPWTSDVEGSAPTAKKGPLLPYEAVMNSPEAINDPSVLADWRKRR